MIISFRAGQFITPVRLINPTMISHWRYAKDCAAVGGGLLPGAELKIVELSKIPGAMWLRVEIPGRHPVATLKIAGEEFALNFRLLR